MGGPVQPGQTYVVGEAGPETFVPTGATPSTVTNAVPQRPVVAIGGHGSTLRDPFFPFIDQVAPGAQKIPLRGTGHGLAGLGVGNALSQIRDALRTNAPNTLFIGNSIGGPLLRKAISQVDPEGTNTQRQAIFVDPPNLDAYGFPVSPPRPFSYLSPTATLIKSQVRKGIMTDPNTVSFTQGRWMNDFKHSPWINPDDPTNAVNIQRLTEIIRSKSALPVGTNGPSFFTPPVPGVIVPKN